ncbi:MAG: hypothetical protein AB1330_05685 [Bacillota bacterium]
MAINTNVLNRIPGFLLRRWSCEEGYREFLTMAVPLILTTGMWSVQHFIDHMFLGVLAGKPGL